jgi:hypothetical protein
LCENLGRNSALLNLFQDMRQPLHIAQVHAVNGGKV